MHAAIIECTGDPRTAMSDAGDEVRVLRRLRLVEGPTGMGDPDAGAVAVVVDVETTGFDADEDAVIELALRRVRHDAEGVVTRIGRLFSWREDPGRPIPSDISRLTGLSDADVTGAAIDTAEATRLIAEADLVVAHHAAFDLRFVERRLPGIGHPEWACSMAEVDWPAHGFDGRKLGHLLAQAGWFHDAHSAGADVDAVIALLRHAMPDGRPAFGHLLESAAQDVWRVRAEGARISLKDLLKRRGYRWDPDARVWHRCVADHDRDAERAWLAERIYAPSLNPFGARPNGTAWRGGDGMRDVLKGDRPPMRHIGNPTAGGGRRLHTATLALVGADGSVFELFHACRVAAPCEVVARLAVRHGASVAAAAAVRVGVDPTHPVVVALLGADAALRLHDDADLLGGALLGGGDLHIVQWRG